MGKSLFTSDAKGHARILRLKYNLGSFTYFLYTVGIWIPGFLWSGFLLINSSDRFYKDEKLCLLNTCKLFKIKSHMIRLDCPSSGTVFRCHLKSEPFDVLTISVFWSPLLFLHVQDIPVLDSNFTNAKLKPETNHL